jgi:hypothetical protein
MKLDPGMHIVMHLVFFWKTGCDSQVLPSWPHQPVLPTVGGSPAAVAHGGGNSKRYGPQRQMYISPKFWFDLLFFENHDKLNIKKFFWKLLAQVYGQQQTQRDLLQYLCVGTG